METIAETKLTIEPGKSFDVLASIRLYRHDLTNYGQILPETRRRVYDEELSYIAEGINRPNAKEFILEERDGQLVYFHHGQWRPYLSTLMSGLEAAKQEAQADPRRAFEVTRRETDLVRGYQMQALRSGDKLHWFHDFPEQALEEHGTKLLGSMGFQPRRRMGFLYQAERLADGRLAMRHHSVDNSCPEAYSTAMAIGEAGGSIEDMRQAYDEELSRQTGGLYYAGRPVGKQSPEEEAWTFIARHHDLINDYFFSQLEALAHHSSSKAELEIAKKRLTYGVWAALKQRLDNQALRVDDGAGGFDVGAEVSAAYAALAARGEELFGCGSNMTGEQALLNASAEDVFNSLFGKLMHCPFCGAGQHGDPCSPNQYCGKCEARVVNGRVVSEGKTRRRTKVGWEDELFGWVPQALASYEAERRTKDEI